MCPDQDGRGHTDHGGCRLTRQGFMQQWVQCGCCVTACRPLLGCMPVGLPAGGLVDLRPQQRRGASMHARRAAWMLMDCLDVARGARGRAGPHARPRTGMAAMCMAHGSSCAQPPQPQQASLKRDGQDVASARRLGPGWHRLASHCVTGGRHDQVRRLQRRPWACYAAARGGALLAESLLLVGDLASMALPPLGLHHAAWRAIRWRHDLQPGHQACAQGCHGDGRE